MDIESFDDPIGNYPINGSSVFDATASTSNDACSNRYDMIESYLLPAKAYIPPQSATTASVGNSKKQTNNTKPCFQLTCEDHGAADGSNAQHNIARSNPRTLDPQLTKNILISVGVLKIKLSNETRPNAGRESTQSVGATQADMKGHIPQTSQKVYAGRGESFRRSSRKIGSKSKAPDGQTTRKTNAKCTRRGAHLTSKIDTHIGKLHDRSFRDIRHDARKCSNELPSSIVDSAAYANLDEDTRAYVTEGMTEEHIASLYPVNGVLSAYCTDTKGMDLDRDDDDFPSNAISPLSTKCGNDTNQRMSIAGGVEDLNRHPAETAQNKRGSDNDYVSYAIAGGYGTGESLFTSHTPGLRQCTRAGSLPSQHHVSGRWHNGLYSEENSPPSSSFYASTPPDNWLSVDDELDHDDFTEDAFAALKAGNRFCPTDKAFRADNARLGSSAKIQDFYGVPQNNTGKELSLIASTPRASAKNLAKRLSSSKKWAHRSMTKSVPSTKKRVAPTSFSPRPSFNTESGSKRARLHTQFDKSCKFPIRSLARRIIPKLPTGDTIQDSEVFGLEKTFIAPVDKESTPSVKSDTTVSSNDSSFVRQFDENGYNGQFESAYARDTLRLIRLRINPKPDPSKIAQWGEKGHKNGLIIHTNLSPLRSPTRRDFSLSDVLSPSSSSSSSSSSYRSSPSSATAPSSASYGSSRLSKQLADAHTRSLLAESAPRTPLENIRRNLAHRECAAARLEGISVGKYRYYHSDRVGAANLMEKGGEALASPAGAGKVEEGLGRGRELDWYVKGQMCICWDECRCSRFCTVFADARCPCLGEKDVKLDRRRAED